LSRSRGLSRRDLGLGLAATATSLSVRRGLADEVDWRPHDLEVRAIRVEGDLSRLFVLAVPRHLEPWERVPLLVLLHGLGETGDEREGAWAWLERYGLGTSYDGLRASGTLRGLVVACPYMPDLPLADPGAFDRYARWIVETVLPRARREAPSAFDRPDQTYLGGCSLGGHFGLEVLLRQPRAFAAWGGVQTAISAEAGERYAARLAACGPHGLLVETSSSDPFRDGNASLARALAKSGVDRAFLELPGPHDQPWLRRSGTAAMLQWFDDRPRPELRAPPPDRRAAPP
jgi:enterochelin esterase-like enzyme